MQFEERNYAVTGYQAFGQRQFQRPGGQLVTTMQLRLDIQQDGGPPGRRATVASIDFGAGAANQIGQLLRRDPPHAEEFKLDVTLPAADFEHYWSILAFTGQAHLRCVVAQAPGHDIEELDITSPKHLEAVNPAARDTLST
jgi:hypothetical protein